MLRQGLFWETGALARSAVRHRLGFYSGVITNNFLHFYFTNECSASLFWYLRFEISFLPTTAVNQLVLHRILQTDSLEFPLLSCVVLHSVFLRALLVLRPEAARPSLWCR